ncbi:T9SS type A sorting domain-containing protein [Neptunitalea lumnitzerae]|uniref:Secretion system C-terminal sorting domain-containing protein n=1 Tax=Neptunitalea lumnitzerae TaxID=2965509 RepID=A0ABQ5MMF8_9FLAO|nr:T9SS type A sorting domain-containing protein [Neptunitalea sp. Y10]GLB50270.1 hypothetical protein Y10_26380 [Neptunitalea sp. Y10]
MKIQLLLIFAFFSLLHVKGQTTAIPDQGFEQWLIGLGIDSDATVNGQVLTSDISGITYLTLDLTNAWFGYIYDLTGIEDFTALEELTINYFEISTIDLSSNLQLKKLNLQSNALTSLDVSANVLLEELYLENHDDVAPVNLLTELDLSNNPNLTILDISNMYTLTKIDLRNNHNDILNSLDVSFSVMPDSQYDPTEVYNTICVAVDDEVLAQNNQLPYNQWNISQQHTVINFSANCLLTTNELTLDDAVTVYPNPTLGILSIDAKEGTITVVELYDTTGRKINEFKSGFEHIDLQCAAGTYFMKINSRDSSIVKKVVVR